MFRNDEAVYERLFTAKDIQAELNLSNDMAHEFMRAHGKWAGRRLAISQREFRLLQGDGTVAAWMSAHSRRRRTVGK